MTLKAAVDNSGMPMPLSKFVSRFRKLVAILIVPLYRRALRKGAAAGVEHARVLRHLNCSTAVDIGANRGQFALAVRHCFPEASIFSFEPLSEPAATFGRVFSGDDKVELFRSAIGPAAGSTLIHVSMRDDSSSLLPIAKAQDRLFPGTAEARTETISVGRLADFVVADRIRSPALLKLDVQGFELSALQGCEDLLPLFEWVYVECSFAELYEGQALADEVIAWLRSHDLMLSGVYNMSYEGDGKAIQADFLFAAAPHSRARSS